MFIKLPVFLCLCVPMHSMRLYIWCICMSNSVTGVNYVRVCMCRFLVWYVVQASVVKSVRVLVAVYLSIDATVCFPN